MRIHLYTNIFPHYRKSLWDSLISLNDFEFVFYFSNKSRQGIETVNVSNEYKSNSVKHFSKIRNIYIGKHIIWQVGVLKSLFNQNLKSAIFLAEMTIISTWIATIILKLKGIKVIYWGHGLYGSEKRLKKFFRLLFLSLADHNLVYEKNSEKNLINNGFDKVKTSIVYNSINFYKQRDLFNKLIDNKPKKIFNNNYPVLLFIGRLTKSKKINQLIDATLLLNKSSNFNLLIIGEGNEKKRLEEQSRSLINQGKCIFYGKCYDEDILSNLIYMSDLTVSPGNVGLTAIHSLSYGTPVCSHSNLINQMPEVEAIKEVENGFLFKEDDIQDMVLKIQAWFSTNKRDKKDIRKIIDEVYNPDYQIKVILNSLI